VCARKGRCNDAAALAVEKDGAAEGEGHSKASNDYDDDSWLASSAVREAHAKTDSACSSGPIHARTRRMAPEVQSTFRTCDGSSEPLARCNDVAAARVRFAASSNFRRAPLTIRRICSSWPWVGSILANLTHRQSGQRVRKIGEHPLVRAKLGTRDQRAA
jgi:hypothetical protein